MMRFQKAAEMTRDIPDPGMPLAGSLLKEKEA